MALTKCRECGAIVSTRAKFCPQCGGPTPKRSRGLVSVLAVTVIVVVLVMATRDTGGPPGDPPKPSDESEVANVSLQPELAAEAEESADDAKVKTLVSEAEAAWLDGNPGWARVKLGAASKVSGASNLDLIHQLHVRMANAQVVALVEDAEEAWKSENTKWMEKKLRSAAKVEKATDFDPINKLRVRMANSKVSAMVAEAVDAIAASNIDVAKKKLQAALDVPHADALTEANKLIRQINNATDPSFIRTTLMEISDSAFKRLQKRGKMPKQLVTGHSKLDSRALALAKAQLADIGDARKKHRQEQLERERAARKEREEEQLRDAEAARQAEARRRKTAKRKKNEQERGTIPLIVENWRWSTKHGYAIVEGEVTNRSDKPLKSVLVVASFYDGDNQFITSSDSLLKYNPVLPGQTSPFKVYATYNPQMKSTRIAFKHFFGGTIAHATR